MQRYPSALQWYAILLVVATVLALTLPPDPATLQTLHISTPEYRLTIVTLLLPLAVIWFAAFYAYAKLKDYAKHLFANREGKGYKKIATGLGVLAFGLAIPTILGL